MNTINYNKTSFFSSLITDYLQEKKDLFEFYNHFPSLENFQKQIKEKKKQYSSKTRSSLVEVLQNQYKGLSIHSKVSENLKLLSQDNTFTVTTGHQLSLFTGPLYFIYKIITAIKTAQLLNKTYKDYQFVPIYWMASEDHDFEEINHFRLFDKTFSWNTHQEGAVGRFNTSTLSNLGKVLKQELIVGKNAQYLNDLFHNAYLNHSTLASATRHLVNELFGECGLICIDADCKILKKCFIPYIQNEIKHQTAYNQINNSSNQLSKINFEYPIQISPREINLFYLKDNIRERIVKEGEEFSVLNTAIKFSATDIEKEIKNYPERFSPNVSMRPLYQEVILPNLCYIGGGGELAYWLQLKSYFKAEKVPFPILLLRNSVLLLNSKENKKLKKLSISNEDLFLSKQQLVNKKIKEISNIPIDFTKQKEFLKNQFTELYTIASKTDASFLGAVKAQEVKQLKGLNKLEKRLLKAQKRKFKNFTQQIEELHESLFPIGGLQERSYNFSQFYLENPKLIEILMKQLDPLDLNFSIVEI